MFVVAGSSGQTGSVVADTLLRHGEQVRLIVRNPARVEAFRTRGAQVVTTDLLDTESLADALRGARGVYLLVPPKMSAQDMLGEHRALIASMTAAVAQAKPEHVVCLSSSGAQVTHGAGPVESLRLAEHSLKQVISNVTFVRPAFFIESLVDPQAAIASGMFPTFLRADRPAAMVGTRDVGQLSAQALLDGPRGVRTLELEGPRRYTPTEAAHELATLAGRAVRIHEVPEAAIAATILSLGMPAQVAQLTQEMFQSLNNGQLTWEHDERLRLRGSTSVREVFEKLLASSRAVGLPTA